jgi:hypothetical protein
VNFTPTYIYTNFTPGYQLHPGVPTLPIGQNNFTPGGKIYPWGPTLPLGGHLHSWESTLPLRASKKTSSGLWPPQTQMTSSTQTLLRTVNESLSRVARFFLTQYVCQNGEKDTKLPLNNQMGKIMYTKSP